MKPEFRFFDPNEPIITSLLDTDNYQTTVANMLHNADRGDTMVKYGLTNRTIAVRLGEDVPIEAFREQLQAARALRYTAPEIAFQRSQRRSDGSTLYSTSYLKTLQTYQLPELDVRLTEDRQFELILPDNGWRWVDGLRWETFILSIISELRFQALIKRHGISEDALYRAGVDRFLEKRAALKKVKGLPGLELGASFMEFGTRRRPSKRWQQKILELCIEYDDAYHFLGTSNEHLSMVHGLEPKGTNSHQGPMGYSALFPDTEEGLIASQRAFLDDWFDCYGRDLAVCLPDAFGTPFCLALMTEFDAIHGKGFRQDSGLPDLFVQRVLAFYQKYGIDTKSKLMIFSDGLNVEEFVRLILAYALHFKTSGGWGTDLVFDFGPDMPIKPISIVVKLIWAMGRFLAKISDNRHKATGPRDRVEHLIQLTHFEEREENNLAVVV